MRPNRHKRLSIIFFLKRKVECHIQNLIWMCLESWKLDYPTLSYKWTLRACFVVLAGEHSYSYTCDWRTVLSSIRESWPPPPSTQLQEECTWGSEGGRGYLSSKISWINPGNQWGDNQVLQPVHPPIHYQILKSAPKFDLNPGQVSQIWLFGASSHTPKVCGFNSWLGHIPRLQVRLPVGVHTGGNWQMFLSLALSPFLSL